MPNPMAIIQHAKAQAELARMERENRDEIHRKLDAILAKLEIIERRIPAPLFFQIEEVDAP
jgi:hypothetical protein